VILEVRMRKRKRKFTRFIHVVVIVYHIEGWLKMCTWFVIYSQIWLNLSRDDCHVFWCLPTNDCHFFLCLPTNDCHFSYKLKFLTETLVVVDHGWSSLEGKPHYESCLKDDCHVPRVNPIVVSFMCTQSSMVDIENKQLVVFKPFIEQFKVLCSPNWTIPKHPDSRTREGSTANHVNWPWKWFHTSENVGWEGIRL
jgi:hypothetical protein